jgi:hypothetical protein
LTILTPTYVQQINGHAAAQMPSPSFHGITPQPPTEPVAVAAPLKVALIGTAPSSRMLAPFSDPTWKIWGCSPGNQNVLPRVDLWFELHSNLLWPEHEAYGRPYLEWLNKQTFPVLMQDQKHVPRATVYPKNEMVAMFGDSFFTSSFAWMMAYAMHQGAVEIALYGIDMASRDEFIRQRPGFFFFKYLAEQRGIKVSAPNESDIMQAPALYAYVDSTPFGRKILARRQEVSGRINGMSQEKDRLVNSIGYLQGALEDLDYFESIWGGVSNDIGRLEYENQQLKAQLAQLQALGLPPQPMAPLMWEPLGRTVITEEAGAGMKVRRGRSRPAPETTTDG